MPNKENIETIRENARRIPVSGNYEVVVAGGGIAGVAAAVAAARNGASVCLLEKNCALGGLATLGNVTMWLPICDGRGRQVMGGLPEELLKLSVADMFREDPAAGFKGIPPCWFPGGNQDERKRLRYRAGFNPAAYLLALEKLALEAGVHLRYDTRVCSLMQESDRITHVIVENKSGRNAVACRTVIDASGDADVCFMAGEPTESQDSNVPAGWFYYLREKNPVLCQMSNFYDPKALKDGAQGPFFRGDDAGEVTAHLLASRVSMREKMAELRAREPGSVLRIFSLPTIACLRMTRRLRGCFSPGMEHVHAWFDDAVGFTGDWRRPGPVYAIPWRSLRGVHSRNLAVAGRCISVDKTIWDVTRAIPACALTGAATGVAAALAVADCNADLHVLPIPLLQRRLVGQGFLLDPALLLAEGDRGGDV